jgi:hypothetical protein
MTANRLLALFSATLLLTILAGCGGSHPLAGVPQGNFTNASLNGTYAFAISGTNAGGFFAVAGNFQANGSGTIVTGLEDINSQGSGVFTNLPISGSYSVRADGRTSAAITSSQGTINLEFVLFNTSSGLAIRFQNTATASGSVDLQTSSAFSLPALAGSFALNLSGVDNAGNPETAAGLITLDAVGDISSGVVDDNDNGVLTTNVAVTAAPLAITNPNGGRGTATVTTPAAPAGLGTLHFVYYVVDANHLKLIETDAGFPLAGDAFRQSSASVSGNFAFTMAGATSAGNGIFVTGGILNTDGAGNIVGGSVQDVYNGGTLSSASAATGTYSLSGGRGLMTLNGGLGALHLVFYPSTGGLQLMGIDPTIVASGSALAQSGGPFSNGSLNGGFGLNFTGVNVANEIDTIAQFTTSGTGTLSGALDVNSGGVLASNLSLTGNYTVAGNGRGTGALNSSAGTVNITLYMVSTSRALFIETDATQVSVGLLAKQQ